MDDWGGMALNLQDLKWNMKFKIIIVLVAIAGTLGLVGCTRKIDGQIFIVTRGAENIKLGAVEVVLVDKTQVLEFLKSKEPDIELKIASYEQTILAASNELQKAQFAYDKFEAIKPDPLTSYQSYLTNFFLSHYYPDFDTTKSRIISLRQQSAKLSAQANALKTRRLNLENQGYSVEESDQENNLYVQDIEIMSEEDSELQKLHDFIDQSGGLFKKAVEIAQSHIDDTKTLLKQTPTVNDYLSDFSPSGQRTMTDADGRFSFSYPKNKLFTIFATGQRSVLNGTEKYYWLVDAPTGTDTKLYLSNNNLVTADPDGYFKFELKPK
jgi:hypothetical protein